MKNLKLIISVLLLVALSAIGLSVQAQQKRSTRRSRARSTARTTLVNSKMTGTYRLDSSRGDDLRAAADRATNDLPPKVRERVFDNLMARLESPDMLAIEQRGRAVTIASSRASRITFDATGRERTETIGNGRTVRSRATLSTDRLDVSSSGNTNTDFDVTFESLDNGRRLNVTRRFNADELDQPIVVQSFYDKSSTLPQWNVYRETRAYTGNTGTEISNSSFIVPDGIQLVAVLNNNLSTKQSHEREPFTLTVREPAQYSGATIDGYVSGITQSGKITGRSQMTLNFERIRLRNGRTYRFAGAVDGVRINNGETVRVDNEGNVESSSQTEKTGVRAVIGTGVGALIGAIAGGGKGAAIGAIVGAGAGAGSVYVQGQENLELRNGTELTIRTSSPGNNR